MQANPWSNIVAGAILATALIACSESADTPPPRHEPDSHQSSKLTPPPPRQGLPRVLDSFLVGEQVYVRSLAVDLSSLWVGTSVGVLEIDLSTQTMRNTFTRKDGLANEYVFAIHVDRHGYKWFGTNAGGVARYRKGQWQVYFPMHGLADYWVYAFAEHPHGPLWIGTWAGVNRVELDSLQFSTYVKELINEWVYAIAIDSRNRVWFGTEGGITMFDGQSWRHWTHEDGLGAANGDNKPSSPNTGLGTRSRHDLSVTVAGRESYNPNYIFALLVDPSDNVWAGTWGGGVARFDGHRWRNFTREDGLAGDIVYSMVRDPAGVFWFGTNRGLTRYDGKHWINLSRADGLLGDHVFAIASTPDGELWVGTKRGVSRIGY